MHRRELPPASSSHSMTSAKKQAAMQAAKSDSPVSINCPLCNSSFSDQYSFTQHMQQHATVDKPFSTSDLNKTRSESAGMYSTTLPYSIYLLFVVKIFAVIITVVFDTPIYEKWRIRCP